MDTEKKERERVLLDWFLMDKGFDENDWIIREREGPDFDCVMPDGSVLGIEVTEMLEPWQGRDRANDGDLTSLIKDVVSQHIELHSGSGAYVYGNNRCVPSSQDWKKQFRSDFRQHLFVHGNALQKDGGAMEVSFHHSWGIVDSVHRVDQRGKVIMLRHGIDRQEYEESPTVDQIEKLLCTAVSAKALKSVSWHWDWGNPIWLVVRNPFGHVKELSQSILEELQELNAGKFDQIYFHNLKMNTYDPYPPEPKVLKVLRGGPLVG